PLPRRPAGVAPPDVGARGAVSRPVPHPCGRCAGLRHVLVGGFAEIGRRREPSTLRRRRLSDGGAGAGATTLEGATLVLAHAAPDACVLAGLQGPREALGGHGAAVADDLRLGDLSERGTGITDGEEQLGILVAADGLVAPIHGNSFNVRALSDAQGSTKPPSRPCRPVGSADTRT